MKPEAIFEVESGLKLSALLVTLSPTVICASPVALAERKVREVREGIGFIPFPHFVHFPQCRLDLGLPRSMLHPLVTPADGAIGLQSSVSLVRRTFTRRPGVGLDRVHQEPRPAAEWRGVG
jgi:hypothetical protein